MNKFNMNDLLTVVDNYPLNHPAYLAAMRQVIDLLAPEKQQLLFKVALDALGNPEPDAYDINGNAIYSVETVSQYSNTPIDEIEACLKLYEYKYGKADIDKTITVLKQPKEDEITYADVINMALEVYATSAKAKDMLSLWFELAIQRGLKPIVTEQIKQLINQPDLNEKQINYYLQRIYKYVTPEEFVTGDLGDESV